MAVAANKGMFARVARNMVKMGYFRTDDETVRCVISHIQMEGRTNVLDPCAGEGLALADFKSAFGEQAVCFGIELDAERAETARRRADVLVHASYDEMYISTGAFGVLFLNPPYGESGRDKKGRTHRLEVEFFRRTEHYLAAGGVLVYIVPHYSLTDGIIRTLACYRDLHVWRAADPTYKQVVIMGASPGMDRKDGDPNASELLLRARADLESVPVIGMADEPIYTPPSGLKVKSFRPKNVSDQDIRALVEANESGNRLIAQLRLRRTDIGRPLVPVRDGHIPVLVAAGALDGKLDMDGRSLLVKGSCYRIAETVGDDDEGENGKGDGKRKETHIIHHSVPSISLLEYRDGKAHVSIVESGANAMTVYK